MEDKTLENLVKDKTAVNCYLKAVVEDTAMIHVEIDGENQLVCYPKRELEAAGIREKMYFKVVPYKDDDNDKVVLNFVPGEEKDVSPDEGYAPTTRISVGSRWHKQKN